MVTPFESVAILLPCPPECYHVFLLETLAASLCHTAVMATIDHARHALIAVVDDDQGMLASLALLLGSAGYEVRLFSSAAALLESGELRLIDCLISDLGMPEMNGFELGREARAARPDLPIVFVTGRPELLSSSAVDGIGPHRSFTKPFSSGEFLAAIAELLRGPNQRAPRG